MTQIPRAHEAVKEFERRGYPVSFGTFEKGPYGGSWIRVCNVPDDNDPKMSVTDDFTWMSSERYFVGEISNLRDKDIPRFLKSSKTGKIIELEEPTVHLDKIENEILYWEMKPKNWRNNPTPSPDDYFVVRIFND